MVRGIGKFLVLKNEDLDRYLGEKQEQALFEICQTIEVGRMVDGKVDDNFYIVINQDEPYADDVKAIMKSYGHWEEKTNND